MDNFVNRLDFLLKHYSLNASSFADKIGVQRSSLSHILSGRNKASLDFILKISEAFPEVKIEWLIQESGTPFSDFTSSENESNNPFTSTPKSDSITENSTTKKEEKTTPISTLSNSFFATNDVEQIVVFYKDGTFSTYKPR